MVEEKKNKGKRFREVTKSFFVGLWSLVMMGVIIIRQINWMNYKIILFRNQGVKKMNKTKKEKINLEDHNKKYIHITKESILPLIGTIFFGILSYLNLYLFDWEFIKFCIFNLNITKHFILKFSHLINICPIIGEYILISLTIISILAFFKGGYKKIISFKEEGLMCGLGLGLTYGLTMGGIIGLMYGLGLGLGLGLMSVFLSGFVSGFVSGLIIGLGLGILIFGLISGLTGEKYLEYLENNNRRTYKIKNETTNRRKIR